MTTDVKPDEPLVFEIHLILRDSLDKYERHAKRLVRAEELLPRASCTRDTIDAKSLGTRRGSLNFIVDRCSIALLEIITGSSDELRSYDHYVKVRGR